MRPSAALSSVTQYAMPSEFGGKWETECLKTRFSLPTLMCAGYRVKLIITIIKHIFQLKLELTLEEMIYLILSFSRSGGEPRSLYRAKFGI